MAFFWVVVIRGGKNPLVVESDCKIAEALTLVVFMYAPPLVVSIALKSAAEVKVGLINRPLVIPFAPPVWLIVPLY